MARIFGYHHLSLSVRDLDKSVRWYEDVLGLEVEAEIQGETFRRKRLRSPEGVTFTLTQHDEQSPEPFSERRTGMDHFAFHVAEDDIGPLMEHFKHLGVTHSEVEKSPSGSAIITLRDPDNIQLEVCGGPLRPPAAGAGSDSSGT